MKIIPLALALSLGVSGAALAQEGAPAKGNAPVKKAHTVNDGGAKKGANSFTEGQAREHIEKSGYSSVSGLAKGTDGVWRGTAMKGGVSKEVAMDFKGNVSEDGAGAAPRAMTHTTRSTHAASTNASTAPMADGSSMSGDAAMGGAAAGGATTTADSTTTTTHHMRHHRRHHHHSGTHPGAAKSGVDKNDNGISDREDRARSQ